MGVGVGGAWAAWSLGSDGALGAGGARTIRQLLQRSGPRLLTRMHRVVACACCVATSKPALVIGAIYRFLVKMDISTPLTLTLRGMGWVGPQRGSGLGQRRSGYPPRCPYSAVRKWMPGVCPAGCVGGQATQPGSTRTPCPSVQQSGVGVRHTALLGGDASHVGTDIRAKPSNCAETLKASGTVLGWRHPTDTMW